MNEASRRPRRRRNTILAALELFRETVKHEAPLRSMTLFLYVCENEGLCVTELAHVARMNIATTARMVRILAGEAKATAPGMVLFDCRPTPGHGRLKTIWLSAAGLPLRDQCELLIDAAAPIARPPRPGPAADAEPASVANA